MYIYVCVQLFNLIWFITKFLDGNFILRKLKLKKKKEINNWPFPSFGLLYTFSYLKVMFRLLARTHENHAYSLFGIFNIIPYIP